MKKLCFFILFTIMVCSSCSKADDTLPTPPPKIFDYSVTLTVDNQTGITSIISVCYGLDNGSSQQTYIPLTIANFPVGISTQSFGLDNPTPIYMLFILNDTNTEIAIDGENNTMIIYGPAYNQSLFKLSKVDLSFTVKLK